ncbi:MAG: hypothetical protein LM522_00380 [Candidatus Contendobacter sp.]|nr:hypothetical protein [Candidatus Contendobacter sp.]
MKPLTPFRRAMIAAHKIPNAPAKDRANRVHAWAEFVKQAIRDEDAEKVLRATKTPLVRGIAPVAAG